MNRAKTVAARVHVRLVTFWFYYHGTEAIQLFHRALQESKKELVLQTLRKAIRSGERAFQNEKPEVYPEDLEYLSDVLTLARHMILDNLPQVDAHIIISLIEWITERKSPQNGGEAVNEVLNLIEELKFQIGQLEKGSIEDYYRQTDIVPWPVKRVAISCINSMEQNDALWNADRHIVDLEVLVRNWLPYLFVAVKARA